MEMDLDSANKDSSIMGFDSVGEELNEIIRRNEDRAEIVRRYIELAKKATYMELPLSEPTMKGIEYLCCNKTMSSYVAVIIQLLLEGKDVMAAVERFHQKEFSLLIPAVEMLYQSQFTPQKGIGAIFICPTPLAASFAYQTAKSLVKYHSLTVDSVGGFKADSPEKTLEGVNLLIATPHRLLDHLQNTESFICRNLKYLVIFEVDGMVDLGFEEEVRKIIDILPKIRQTISFTSKPTMKGEVLARLSLPATGVLISYKEMHDVVLARGSRPPNGLPWRYRPNRDLGPVPSKEARELMRARLGIKKCKLKATK